MRYKQAVLMYDMNDNLLKRYNSIQEAYIDTGIARSTIFSQCNSEGRSRGDVYFRYENKKNKPKKYNYISHKKVVELTINGEFVKV